MFRSLEQRDLMQFVDYQEVLAKDRVRRSRITDAGRAALAELTSQIVDAATSASFEARSAPRSYSMLAAASAALTTKLASIPGAFSRKLLSPKLWSLSKPARTVA